jgi:hypothetical protein
MQKCPRSVPDRESMSPAGSGGRRLGVVGSRGGSNLAYVADCCFARKTIASRTCGRLPMGPERTFSEREIAHCDCCLVSQRGGFVHRGSLGVRCLDFGSPSAVPSEWRSVARDRERPGPEIVGRRSGRNSTRGQ